MSYPSSRRYPRSLAEAFPRQHANPIEHFPEPLARRFLRAVVCFAAVAAIGAMFALGV